ncbi:MAG: hypothetical protein U1D30_05425 [Planctomycetota bacterium]
MKRRSLEIEELMMPSPIIDLWREGEEDATRLYIFYLEKLRSTGNLDQLGFTCRRIRQYAARGPGKKEALFTFWIEIEALCEIGDFDLAWRRLRQWEAVVFGKRLRLDQHRWNKSEGLVLAFYYAPLLYLRGRHRTSEKKRRHPRPGSLEGHEQRHAGRRNGFSQRRYRLGCKLLETHLELLFRQGISSYDMMVHVHNDDEEPENHCRVTLAHFYHKLGRTLSDWRRWRAFSGGFPPKLYGMAKVEREALIQQPALLATFHERLRKIERQRISTGGSRGVADLLESPAKVRKRQDVLAQKLKESSTNNAHVRKLIHRKLRLYFPDLKGSRLP